VCGCVLCVLEREKTQESEKMCFVERKCVVVVWEKKEWRCVYIEGRGMKVAMVLFSILGIEK